MRSTFLSVTALASLLGAILLGVVIWLFSPLLGETFDNPILRGALAGVPFLIWLLVFLIVARRRSGRDAAIVAEVAKPDPIATIW